MTAAGTVSCAGNNWYGQASPPPGLLSSPGELAATAGDARVWIVSGKSHSCALLTNASVVCWGSNMLGQTHVPAALSGVAASLSAGRFHTCAVTTALTAVCWGGTNAFGEASVPPGLAGRTVAVAAGGAHTCVLTTTAAVTCFGWNGYGQTAVPDATVGRVASVSTGYGHTCVVLISSEAVCWGRNHAGQTTVPAAAASNVLFLHAGTAHTCVVRALDSADRLAPLCWGALSVALPGAGGGGGEDNSSVSAIQYAAASSCAAPAAGVQLTARTCGLPPAFANLPYAAIDSTSFACAMPDHVRGPTWLTIPLAAGRTVPVRAADGATEWMPGSVCYFQCAANTVLAGPPAFMCEASGEWVPAGMTPTALRGSVACPDIVPPTATINGTAYAFKPDCSVVPSMAARVTAWFHDRLTPTTTCFHVAQQAVSFGRTEYCNGYLRTAWAPALPATTPSLPAQWSTGEWAMDLLLTATRYARSYTLSYNADILLLADGAGGDVATLQAWAVAFGAGAGAPTGQPGTSYTAGSAALHPVWRIPLPAVPETLQVRNTGRLALETMLASSASVVQEVLAAALSAEAAAGRVAWTLVLAVQAVGVCDTAPVPWAIPGGGVPASCSNPVTTLPLMYDAARLVTSPSTPLTSLLAITNACASVRMFMGPPTPGALAAASTTTAVRLVVSDAQLPATFGFIAATADRTGATCVEATQADGRRYLTLDGPTWAGDAVWQVSASLSPAAASAIVNRYGGRVLRTTVACTAPGNVVTPAVDVLIIAAVWPAMTDLLVESPGDGGLRSAWSTAVVPTQGADPGSPAWLRRLAAAQAAGVLSLIPAAGASASTSTGRRLTAAGSGGSGSSRPPLRLSLSRQINITLALDATRGALSAAALAGIRVSVGAAAVTNLASYTYNGTQYLRFTTPPLTEVCGSAALAGAAAVAAGYASHTAGRAPYCPNVPVTLTPTTAMGSIGYPAALDAAALLALRNGDATAVALELLLDTAATAVVPAMSCPPACPPLDVTSLVVGGTAAAALASGASVFVLGATLGVYSDVSLGVSLSVTDGARAVDAGFTFYEPCTGGAPSSTSATCVNPQDPGFSQCAYGAGSNCAACPTGAMCPGGYRTMPLPGYWTSASDASVVLRCADVATARCPGYNATFGHGTCAPGYDSRTIACAGCQAGYYDNAASQACETCASRSQPADALGVALYIVVPLVLLAALGAIPFLCAYPSSSFRYSAGVRQVAILAFVIFLALQPNASIARLAARGTSLLARVYRVLLWLQFDFITWPAACSWGDVAWAPVIKAAAALAAFGGWLVLAALRVAGRATLSALQPTDGGGSGGVGRRGRNRATSPPPHAPTKAPKRGCLRAVGDAAGSGVTVLQLCLLLAAHLMYATVVNSMYGVFDCAPSDVTVRAYVALESGGGALSAASPPLALLRTCAVNPWADGCTAAVMDVLDTPVTVSTARAFPLNVCWEGRHLQLSVLAGVTLVVFGVGFPLAVLVVTVRRLQALAAALPPRAVAEAVAADQARGHSWVPWRAVTFCTVRANLAMLLPASVRWDDPWELADGGAISGTHFPATTRLLDAAAAPLQLAMTSLPLPPQWRATALWGYPVQQAWLLFLGGLSTWGAPASHTVALAQAIYVVAGVGAMMLVQAVMHPYASGPPFAGLLSLVSLVVAAFQAGVNVVWQSAADDARVAQAAADAAGTGVVVAIDAVRAALLSWLVIGALIGTAVVALPLFAAALLPPSRWVAWARCLHARTPARVARLLAAPQQRGTAGSAGKPVAGSVVLALRAPSTGTAGFSKAGTAPRRPMLTNPLHGPPRARSQSPPSSEHVSVSGDSDFAGFVRAGSSRGTSGATTPSRVSPHAGARFNVTPVGIAALSASRRAVRSPAAGGSGGKSLAHALELGASPMSGSRRFIRAPAVPSVSPVRATATPPSGAAVAPPPRVGSASRLATASGRLTPTGASSHSILAPKTSSLRLPSTPATGAPATHRFTSARGLVGTTTPEGDPRAGGDSAAHRIRAGGEAGDRVGSTITAKVRASSRGLGGGGGGAASVSPPSATMGGTTAWRSDAVAAAMAAGAEERLGVPVGRGATVIRNPTSSFRVPAALSPAGGLGTMSANANTSAALAVYRSAKAPMRVRTGKIR